MWQSLLTQALMFVISRIITRERLQAVYGIVRQLMTRTDMTNEQKRQYALDWLKRQGVEISDNLAGLAIEAVLARLKRG